MQGLAQENLKMDSTHLNMKVQSVSKSTIRQFWSAEWHFKSAKLHSFRLWPNFLQVLIRHSLFDLCVERCISIRILLVVAYFLSIPISINKDWISKFSTLFYALRGHFLTLLNCLYFLIPSLIFLVKLGF